MDCVYTWVRQDRCLDTSKALKILEIGSGSGIVIASLMLLFPNATATALEINAHSVQATNQTLKLNNLPEICIQSDLFNVFGAKRDTNQTESFKQNKETQQFYDLIVFNPPYCPGYVESLGDADLALSGGKQGREVIDRFLSQLPQFLALNGAAFLVTIHHNDPKNIVKEINEKLFHAEIYATKRLQSEVLYVILITNNK